MIAEDIVARLQVIATDKLRSHEEIIPFNFQRLRESMLNMGRLVDPIIVDNEHNIVIDGNHRKAVLDSIKCPNAACQLVDYKSEEIGVSSGVYQRNIRRTSCESAAGRVLGQCQLRGPARRL